MIEKIFCQDFNLLLWYLSFGGLDFGWLKIEVPVPSSFPPTPSGREDKGEGEILRRKIGDVTV
jgi:hypothetical protein